jgi:hypothetical protein
MIGIGWSITTYNGYRVAEVRTKPQHIHTEYEAMCEVTLIESFDQLNGKQIFEYLQR